METIILISWGFLIGFIGWGSCFRLVEPIGNWLIPTRKTSPLKGWVQIIVITFLIMSIFVLLALLPIIVFLFRDITTNENDIWRRLYGITFISSLIGLFVLGLINRIKGGTTQGHR